MNRSIVIILLLRTEFKINRRFFLSRDRDVLYGIWTLILLLFLYSVYRTQYIYLTVNAEDYKVVRVDRLTHKAQILIIVDGQLYWSAFSN
jgi:hypothetical protein